jgi:TRAP-type C4-dicarboxylate transport system substrate-binding protein
VRDNKRNSKPIYSESRHENLNRLATLSCSTFTDTFDPMEASLFMDITEEEQEIFDRAMNELAESAR